MASPLAVGSECGLGCRAMQHRWRWCQRSIGRDVDDHAGAAFEHRRQQRGVEPNRSEVVCVQGVLPFFVGNGDGSLQVRPGRSRVDLLQQPGRSEDSSIASSSRSRPERPARSRSRGVPRRRLKRTTPCGGVQHRTALREPIGYSAARLATRHSQSWDSKMEIPG